jgi:hypothetical protein
LAIPHFPQIAFACYLIAISLADLTAAISLLEKPIKNRISLYSGYLYFEELLENSTRPPENEA